MLFVSASAFFGLQGEVIVLFGEALPSGGMLGSSIAYLLLTGFSATGAYIITLTASVLALMLLTPFSPLKALAWLRTMFDSFVAQLDLLITVYQGRKEKAKEAKRHPAMPKTPPRIVEDQKTRPPQVREQKPEKPAKPMQEAFGFMENKDAKGTYQLPTIALLTASPR
jgi:hypothetical protein